VPQQVGRVARLEGLPLGADGGEVQLRLEHAVHEARDLGHVAGEAREGHGLGVRLPGQACRGHGAEHAARGLGLGMEIGDERGGEGHEGLLGARWPR